ncbi:MAG: hemolysin III family protein [Chloroflexota bacterium]
MLKRIREPVNGLTHFFAAIVAAIGAVVLVIIGWTNPAKIISVLIYGVSLVSMFAASATYHTVQAKEKVLVILRKVDHSAIYFLIAGTYTPICINAFSGFWKWGLLSIIWSLALIGIGVKIFIIKSPRWLNAVIYLIMGWLCFAAVGEMIAKLPPWALAWLIVGGVTYTLGAIVYMTKIMNFKPGVFGFHEVWHIFVILAALAHFIAIAVLIVPGGSGV